MTGNPLDGEIRNGKHHQQVRVYYEDTDFSGVVYHASYLRFMERGRTNYLRLIGADHRALFEQAAAEAPGFAFVVRHMAGLGLSMSYGIITKFGGNIIFTTFPADEYPEKHGTTFTVYLPIAPEPEAGGAESSEPKAVKS